MASPNQSKIIFDKSSKSKLSIHSLERNRH